MAKTEQEKHQEAFQDLLRELETTHAQKIREYGLERYDGESIEHNLRAAFYDVDRKYIRLKHQISSHVWDLDALRETFMDLASYGIMGMQIIDIIEGKES